MVIKPSYFSKSFLKKSVLSLCSHQKAELLVLLKLAGSC